MPFRRWHEHRQTGGEEVAVVRELASSGVERVLRVDDPRVVQDQDGLTWAIRTAGVDTPAVDGRIADVENGPPACRLAHIRRAGAGSTIDPAAPQTYFRCLLTSLVISNMFTAALPPKTAFSAPSALIVRLFLGSWSLFFLM